MPLAGSSGIGSLHAHREGEIEGGAVSSASNFYYHGSKSRRCAILSTDGRNDNREQGGASG